jgi:hypothetical protein
MYGLNLYLLPKRFSHLHCIDQPTTTRLDYWYEAQFGMTRVFAEPLLMEIVGGALNDALLKRKHQIYCDLLRSVLKRCVVRGIEGLNDNAPAAISGVKSDRIFAGL